MATSCSAGEGGSGPGADVPPPFDADRELRVSFLDVGQGDATLLQSPDATVLVDAGRHDRDDLLDHLDAHGVTQLDVVIATHAHADHIGQLDHVLDELPVAEVWMPGTPHTTATFERALDALERSEATYEEPRAGDSTTVGDLEVRVLHPEALTGDLHADCLSVRVDYGDLSVLFTGDAEHDAEAEMLGRDAATLRADVYQVGHHGSATSTTAGFLDAVDPAVAVYSAGEGNPYGHPHAEVVDRLHTADVELFGTDVHGTVWVISDGGRWRVHTERDGGVRAGDAGDDEGRDGRDHPG